MYWLKKIINNNPTLLTTFCLTSALVILIISLFIFRKFGFNDIWAYVSSFVIAVFSLLIAWSADWKMGIISRADIIGVIRALERSRFNFFNKMNRFEKDLKVVKPNFSKKEFDRLKYEGKQIIEIATWECVMILRQANILKGWTEYEDKKKFAAGVIILMDNVFYFFKTTEFFFIINRHIEHLLMSCIELNKLEIDESSKNKIINLFQENKVGKIKPEEVNFEGFISRKLKEIRTDPEGKLTKDEYLNQPFKGLK